MTCVGVQALMTRGDDPRFTVPCVEPKLPDSASSLLAMLAVIAATDGMIVARLPDPLTNANRETGVAFSVG